MTLGINPLIALGVLASTAATDAAYVFFNAAVTSRRRIWAANWSAIWYMLSAFAVISYTENAVYVAFAALGSWLGVPPTGRRAHWTAAEIYRVTDGKIAEQRLVEDWTTVLVQLGALSFSI